MKRIGVLRHYGCTGGWVHVVIVGNGVAGMEAALSIRARQESWKITIVSEESDNFFSRTALMYVLSGQLAYKDIEPLERDVYERMRFERVRERVMAVHAEANELELASGTRLSYDKLLLAVGSSPRPAPFWEGYDTLSGVGHFVTLQDLEWLEDELHGGPGTDRPLRHEHHLATSPEDSPYRPRSSARAARGGPPKNPAVIGGGLIGIECIETFLAAGCTPSFLIRDDAFWPIALDKKEAAWIAEALTAHGVNVLLEHNVEKMEGSEGRVTALQTDQGKVDADLVVVAIGVVPATDFLKDSAVKLAERGGIVVDEGLRSSVDNIWAAGDCAVVKWFNGWERPQQLWYTGRDQGRLVAKAIVGDDVSYKRGTWYNSAKLMDIEYTTAGLVNMEVEGEEEWFFEEKGSVRSTTRIVHVGGAVIGFNCLGRRWDHSFFVRWIEERRSLQWVLKHLNKARFDTEFVPALRLP